MTVAMTQPESFTARLTRLADWLAVAIAVSLPWSTSATAILTVAWTVVVLGTLDRASLERITPVAAAVLPVVIVAYAAIAMLWADIAWPARLQGLSSVAKLLLIPLLFIHFRRTGNARPVFLGFFVSAFALFLLSWLMAIKPEWFWKTNNTGVPVKDYIIQSGVFSLCVIALMDRAMAAWSSSRRLSLAYLGIAVLFFANIMFVATGRTTLVVLAVLLVLFGVMHFRRTALVAFLAGLVVIAASVWATSPYLRDRVLNVAVEIRTFDPNGNDTSSGARLAFWEKSLGIIAEAPLLGHGTGTTREVMSRSFGVSPDSPGAPSNPHNQILAIGIPWGSVGMGLLLAMWFAHARLFMVRDQTAFIGLAVVTQNVVAGLFNSHLLDFTQGWLYVLGVGVAGGALMHRHALEGRPADRRP